jgi:hypothetical protein
MSNYVEGKKMNYIEECVYCPARRAWTEYERRNKEHAEAARASEALRYNTNQLVTVNNDLQEQIEALKNERESLWCEIHDQSAAGMALRETNAKYRVKQIWLTVSVGVLVALLGTICLIVLTGGVS